MLISILIVVIVVLLVIVAACLRTMYEMERYRRELQKEIDGVYIDSGQVHDVDPEA